MAGVHLEFLVEEPSMEAFLRSVVPKVVPTTTFDVHTYRGKADLLKKLPSRLLGYAAWLPEAWRVIVVVDRDDDDCGALKARLERCARDAGLLSLSVAREGRWRFASRIAIEELEAWFFGDGDAVRAVFRGVSESVPRQARYRDPDAIRGGTWEALERVLDGSGHGRGTVQKVNLARAVAEHFDPDRCRSASFRVFRDALVTAARDG